MRNLLSFWSDFDKITRIVFIFGISFSFFVMLIAIYLSFTKEQIYLIIAKTLASESMVIFVYTFLLSLFTELYIKRFFNMKK